MESEKVLKASNIMIIGYACTGKSTIAKLISSKTNHELIQTDDYINHWSRLIESLLGRKNIIIEGTDGFRLLRFGYEPDLIIHCTAEYNWRIE